MRLAEPTCLECSTQIGSVRSMRLSRVACCRCCGAVVWWWAFDQAVTALREPRARSTHSTLEGASSPGAVRRRRAASCSRTASARRSTTGRPRRHRPRQRRPGPLRASGNRHFHHSRTAQHRTMFLWRTPKVGFCSPLRDRDPPLSRCGGGGVGLATEANRRHPALSLSG
jgi:hypothetical protein